MGGDIVEGAVGGSEVKFKKLKKESVVCLRTAPFLGNLDGRHRSQVTQDIDSKTR